MVRDAEPVVYEGREMIGPNNEGHRANGAPQIKTQTQRPDYSSDDGVGKAFDTLRAQLEMFGCGLHEMADRGYFVSHCNVSRQLPDLRAVRQMLMQIGGRA